MYEYKVIAVPVRAPRVKGSKSAAERFAHGLTEALNTMAAEGWQYLRAETLPCEERKGLTGTRRTEESVLVFRRALSGSEPMSDSPPYEAAPEPTLVRVWASDHDRQPLPGSAPAAVPFRADPQLRLTPGAPDSHGSATGRSEPTLRKPRED